MENWKNTSPEELLALLENGQIKADQIIDVREPFEWEYYRLEQSTLIPMNSIPSRLPELDNAKPLYIICAHGVRSAAVCDYLEKQGCGELHNVTGGMAAIASLRGFQYD